MGVKWGILGTAGIAAGCTIPGMKQAENCELYAIAGRNEKKVLEFIERYGFEKAYVGYDALLADPQVQAVYIPLPNDIHYEWVLKAVKAGKHVLCEKPMALNAAEAQAMYAAARENGVILMEAFAYLHSPYVDMLKEDVKSGIIGEVDYIETAFLTQGYKEDFRLHKEFGGGAFYDLGCYCTTMILTLAEACGAGNGAEISVGEGKSCAEKSTADMSVKEIRSCDTAWKPAYVKAVAEFTEEGVDMMTAGIMRFENGLRASFNVGMNLGINSNSRFDRLYVHGSKGCIRSDVEYNQAGELKYTVVTEGKTLERKVYAGQNYALELEQMNRCILYGEKPHVTPEFSIANAGLMDEVLKEIGY